MPIDNELRNELRTKLRNKLEDSKMTRFTKQNKEKILEKSLKQMNIDKEKLKKDIEEVNNQGGLTFNLNK
jgi:SMC interacting uncharacterized protein involved in chromosome segregation